MMKYKSKNSAWKGLVAAIAVAGSALTPLAAAPAAADGWNRGEGVRHVGRYDCDWRHGKRVCGPRYSHRHGPRHIRRHDDGSTAAAIILGITGAAIVAGALSNANPPPVYETYPAPNAYPPAPSRGPKVITYEASLEPWTRGWYEWCDDRYRSFNPKTGTYRGYDGLDHFCVPK